MLTIHSHQMHPWVPHRGENSHFVEETLTHSVKQISNLHIFRQGMIISLYNSAINMGSSFICSCVLVSFGCGAEVMSISRPYVDAFK